MGFQVSGGLLERLNEIAELDGLGVSVGLQGGGGAPGRATDAELVAIGASHEFGKGRRHRPFLQHAVSVNGHQWLTNAIVVARVVVQGGRPTKMLRVMGGSMVEDVQDSIFSGPWHRNADVTILRKGRDQPLIDTRQMIESIRSAIVRGGRRQII